VAYLEVVVHILGYFVALLGIYFASKPLAQNTIAIIVTVAIVFSVMNSISSVKEAEYSKHLSTQLMRSSSPADWFLDEISDIQFQIIRNEYGTLKTNTTSDEKHSISIRLFSKQIEPLPAPLMGIATLGLIDYQDLSLLPKESLSEGVSDYLFQNKQGIFESADVERLLLAMEIIYSAAVRPERLEKSNEIKTDKSGLVTSAHIELNGFKVSFNREELERLFNCTPIERNLEFARIVAKEYPNWVQQFSDDVFMLSMDTPLCGLQ